MPINEVLEILNEHLKIANFKDGSNRQKLAEVLAERIQAAQLEARVDELQKMRFEGEVTVKGAIYIKDRLAHLKEKGQSNGRQEN